MSSVPAGTAASTITAGPSSRTRSLLTVRGLSKVAEIGVMRASASMPADSEMNRSGNGAGKSSPAVVAVHRVMACARFGAVAPPLASTTLPPSTIISVGPQAIASPRSFHCSERPEPRLSATPPAPAALPRSAAEFSVAAIDQLALETDAEPDTPHIAERLLVTVMAVASQANGNATRPSSASYTGAVAWNVRCAVAPKTVTDASPAAVSVAPAGVNAIVMDAGRASCAARASAPGPLPAAGIAGSSASVSVIVASAGTMTGEPPMSIVPPNAMVPLVMRTPMYVFAGAPATSADVAIHTLPAPRSIWSAAPVAPVISTYIAGAAVPARWMPARLRTSKTSIQASRPRASTKGP